MREYFMREALRQALIAYRANDIPVGAVVVQAGQIIGRGYNTREALLDPCGHAEINALRQAALFLGNWRLTGCELYVTLEPCLMCTGAILDARIESLWIGAFDADRGAVTGKVPVIREEMLPHQLHYEYLKTSSACLLRRFFRERRRKK